MKNDSENLDLYMQKSNKCSICNSENLALDISKIRNNKLKKILTQIDKEDLINKCKCSNEEKVVHKICLLLNVIFNFETKCRQCKSNYNISIDKTINNSKKLCKLFSYLFLTLFHIILFAAAAFLILYVLVINKDIKNDFGSKKYSQMPFFFAAILLIINIILIPITYSNFIDKNEMNIYDYKINIFDEKEQNKIKIDSDKFYSLLYEFYRYFYGTRIRYLINKKQKGLYFSLGYANFNKEIKKMIKESNQLIDIDLNKIDKNDKFINEFHYTGTLGNINKIKNTEIKNNSNNSDNSNEKNSKNTNPINLQLSLIKKDNEENNSHKDNMDDIFIINNNLKSEKDKKYEKKTFNSISIYSNKNFNIMSKSCFYKKLDQNKLLLKSRTYKTKSDRKKEKKENSLKIEPNKNLKKINKINDDPSGMIYADSTFLLKNENNKENTKKS